MNFLKGFLVGIANVIPGVSGGTLAIICGVYEKIIGILSNIVKGIKDNFWFLIFFILGAVVSVVIGSIVIPIGLEKAPLVTILLFAGLIIGGIPLLIKKLKGTKFSFTNIIIFLCTFTLVILFSVLTPQSRSVNLTELNFGTVILVFLVGVIAAATMIIPGISGSLVLMLLGYYEPILKAIKEVVTFTNVVNNLLILFPFAIGCFIGIIFIAKVLEYLLKNYEIQTYYGIIGFVLASLFSIFYKAAPDISLVFQSVRIWTNVLHIVFGVLLFLVGGLFTYRLSSFEVDESSIF